MRLGAVTPSYNTEKFIVPYLRMMTRFVDRIVILQGSEPWKDYAKQFDYGTGPDKSESMAKRFKKVEVYPAEHDFSAQLYNQGLDIIGNDCDYILRFDTDMFLAPKNFKRLLKFIEDNPYDCYRVDFSKCTVEYQNGNPLRCAIETDPIAVKSGVRFKGFFDISGSNFAIDWPDFTLHHFRGEKLSTKPFKPPKEIEEYFK